MPRDPRVRVRDKETGHEYTVPEARYRLTPELWDRVGPEPRKPKTTVDASAAKKKAASQAATKNPDSTESGNEAGSTANQKEN